MTCRKNWRDLDADEIARFVSALRTLKANGTIDAFAGQHQSLFDSGIHHTSHFLPWHRDFLRRFEDALQAIDARITIPYWNSTVDQSSSDGLWADSFLGQFDGDWGLGRTFSGPLPAPQTLTDKLGLNEYQHFWHETEIGLHNDPHNWVGGVMATRASPGDPIFYLHHCWIDTVWAEWQLGHLPLDSATAFQSSGNGFGVDDTMAGVTSTPRDVLDHREIDLIDFPATTDFPEVDPPRVMPEVIDLVFRDVPEGETRLAAAVFGIDTCETLTFKVTAGPTLQTGPMGTHFGYLQSPVPADPKVDSKGRLFFTYIGTTNLDSATATATVHCDETGEDFPVTLTANTIARPSAAIVMLLDQSNSMNFESGIAPGVMRKDLLRFSTPTAVMVLDDDHAAAVCSFDQDAHPGIGITPAAGMGKGTINGAISSYQPNPDGWTSIGEGVAFAQGLLTPDSHTVKAMVVLTDGQENHGPFTRRYITDVADQINSHVFAIGLGRAEVLNPTALQNLCNGHNGYMLLTGDLNPDATYRLAKHYQQILAGVTNDEIVLDPDGFIGRGQLQRIPFWLNETDISAKCILLAPQVHALRFALETPEGDVIDPAVAGAHPMVSFERGQLVSVYRVGLPIPLGPHTAQAGRWHALLWIDDKDRHFSAGAVLEQPVAAMASSNARIRFNFTVQAFSNLRLRATLGQNSNDPGATITVRAVLTEYGLAVAARARCGATLTRPDGTSSVRVMPEVEPGVFEASVTANLAGIYAFRIVAEGSTLRGRPFTREQTLTGAVWKGGDAAPPTSRDDPNGERERWCRLIACVLDDKGIRRALAKHDVDLARLRRCLELFCRPKARPPRPQAAERLHSLIGDERIVKVILDAVQRAHEDDHED